MSKTLSYFSVILGLAGTVLLGLDLWQPIYLRKIRDYLSGFSLAVKKMSLVPHDQGVTAHRKTVIQFLSSKNRPDVTFKEAYLKNLEETNFEPDLNLDFRYRSFVYVFTGAAFLAVFVYVCYVKGLNWTISLEGLKALGVYAVMSIGLLGAWFFDAISEMMHASNKHKASFPPLYKIGFRNRHPDIPMQAFTLIQIFMNVLAKLIAIPIRASLSLERYTIANQSPRVLGMFLLFIAGFIQIVVIIVSG